jgi:hypothetical protein
VETDTNSRAHIALEIYYIPQALNPSQLWLWIYLSFQKHACNPQMHELGKDPSSNFSSNQASFSIEDAQELDIKKERVRS